MNCSGVLISGWIKAKEPIPVFNDFFALKTALTLCLIKKTGKLINKEKYVFIKEPAMRAFSLFSTHILT